jgi:hypothetical protein
MPVDIDRTLRRALETLQAEKARIERRITRSGSSRSRLA